MANKRMFSKEIVGSDAFLDMPTSSQLLYFHLGMEADDDGFIGNPKKICRFVGASDDDLKILLSKRFVLMFDSGVVVVKHHRMNNNWDKYNCKRTVYAEEFAQLYIKENKAYTLDKIQGRKLQSDNSLKTVFRIEENRIDKKREEDTDTSLSSLEKPSEELLKEMSSKFKCDASMVRTKANSLADYCRAKGKKYKNYKAFLSNALRKDFGERPPKEKKPIFDFTSGVAKVIGYE